MTNNIGITKEQYKLFEDILNEFEKLGLCGLFHELLFEA